MASFGDENFDENEIDPAAEFLAREQSQLAGLEEDLNNVVQQPSITSLVNRNSSPTNGKYIIITNKNKFNSTQFVTF